MTNQDHNGLQQAPSATNDGAAPAKLVNESRRKVLSGVAASGVILSLVSPTGMACTCQSPSGFLSGNLSHHGGTVDCEGVTPGYWKNHTPWPVFSPSTKFQIMFPNCSSGSPFYNMSLEDVLSNQNIDQAVGSHLVAAYLNAAQGWTPSTVLSKGAVVTIFDDWQTNGYYSPTAGVKWDGAQIVTYLLTTMPN